MIATVGNLHAEGGARMEISSEYLAELLIGIVRAQNALIDAMDRAQPGFRNTHAIPVLSVAANVRSPDPRLIDLPARVLLRMQGRVAIETSVVVADLERLASAPPPAAPVDAPAPVAPAVARAAARASAAAAPAPAAPAAAAAPAPAVGGDLDFGAKS
jgi:hypothetical protein